MQRHQELQVKIANEAITKDLEKHINRKLKLGTKVEPGAEQGTFLLRVFGPTEKDVETIRRRLKFREGSLKIGAAVDRTADATVSVVDAAGRNVVIPLVGTGARLATRLVSGTLETAVGAFSKAGNECVETVQESKERFRSNAEIQKFGGQFRKKPVNDDRFLVK